MPSIYDIDFILQADNINPPPKRLPKITAFIHSLMVPMQWLRDLFFIDYVGGVKYPPYSKIVLYNVGNRITYGNRSNYECIVQSLNNSPLDTNYWIKVQDIYLGMAARSTYNSQKIILENVLNTYFNTTPTTVPLIYITNNAVKARSFIVFPAGIPTATVLPAGVKQKQFVYPAGFSIGVQYNYTIYCPIALANLLTNETPDSAPAISANRAAIIRALVDQYNTTSLKYNIITF